MPTWRSGTRTSPGRKCSLTTALSLGIVSYALATFAFVVGLTLAAVGFVFLRIRSKAVLL